MTAPELKPCPFCGGVPELDYSQFYRSISGGNLGKACAIYCTSCSAYMMECREDHPGVDPEYLMAELASSWNTRADLHDDTKAQLAKAVEALRDMVDHADEVSSPLIVARDVLAEIEKGGV